jgi:uncharacterized membrane protein
MKTLTQFVKTTVIGGFVVILPIAIVVIVMLQAVGAIVDLMAMVGSLLPEFLRDRVPPEVAAGIVIVLACFVAGLSVRTRAGDALNRWFEDKVLGKIPGYSLIKSVSQRVAGYKETEHLTPVIVGGSDGARSLAFLIEEGDVGVTVFVPFAPTPTVGSIQIVPSDRVTKVDASMGQMMDVFGQFGLGLQAVAGQARTPS